jgi:two-component system, NarL family, invasion response regulator UvrY
MSTDQRRRILIVDDHAVVRAGLTSLFEAQHDLAVAASVGSVPEALNLIATNAFDLVMVDVGMPGKSGWDFLKELRSSQTRHPPVLILSAHSEQEYAVQALRLGAAGYLSKSAAPDELLDAVRRVLSGKRYVSADIAEHLASAVLAGDAALQPHERLAPREFQVMLMIASGRSLVDIADQLHVSPKTVTTWRSRILEKLELDSNAELVRYCLQRNLTPG